ncbi:MAG: hypothetical protein NWP82_06960 [Flavobacteriales bacterium]|nr:hypothetical protein [Flavobacteriales bacterium]
MKKSFLSKIVIAIVLFCASLSANAQVARVYVNEFLQIGVGARAMGMSQAQVGSVNDVTSGYWNPAGLMGLGNKLDAALMHSESFAGIAKYDYAAVGKRLDSTSAASFSLIRFGIDDIPNTLDLYDPNGNIDYSRVTTFNAADYAFLFSYRQIGDFARSFGFGFDLGAQYQGKHVCLGAVVRDASSTFNAWSFSLGSTATSVFEQTGNTLPQNGLEIALPRAILGAGYKFNKEKISFLVEGNATVTTDGQRNALVSGNVFSIDPNVGLEVGYSNTIFFRAGVGNAQRVKDFEEEYITYQPNIGIGIRLRKMFIDYALSDVGNSSDVLYSNVFSLKFSL